MTASGRLCIKWLTVSDPWSIVRTMTDMRDQWLYQVDQWLELADPLLNLARL